MIFATTFTPKTSYRPVRISDVMLIRTQISGRAYVTYVTLMRRLPKERKKMKRKKKEENASGSSSSNSRLAAAVVVIVD